MSKHPSGTVRYLYCQRPDRDVPGIVCGYPLPCPHHTVFVDAEKLFGGVLKGRAKPAKKRRARR